MNKKIIISGASRPKNVKPTEVKKLGVLGSGLMGHGITYVSALSGLNLISADVVEVAPAYDHAEVTSLAAATIVYELTNLFAKSKG